MRAGEGTVAGTAPDKKPENRPRAGRWALTAAVTLLALLALSSFLPGGGGQGGASPSSSFSDRSDGVSAWAELLRRSGRHVDRLRGDLEPSVLDPAAAVVVLDAPGLTGEEADTLGRFVQRGGHLVAGGAGAGQWLESVVDEPPIAAGRGARTARPLGGPPPPEVDGVRTVRTAGLGSWQDQGSLEAILRGDNGRVIALAGKVGNGRVVALADPSPVQNTLLADDDNAAFGLGLAGSVDRPVLFAEGVHGYGEGEGLAALPRRWRLALAGLGLAAGAWLLARSRRLGPPEDEARPMPPSRWTYVDAVTGTLARTRRPHEATEPVRQRARELIGRRTGLASDAAPDEIHRAALRLGLTDQEADAVLGARGTGATGPTEEEAAVLAAGRALARLNGGER